jgi:hypothetical protein
MIAPDDPPVGVGRASQPRDDVVERRDVPVERQLEMRGGGPGAGATGDRERAPPGERRGRRAVDRGAPEPQDERQADEAAEAEGSFDSRVEEIGLTGAFGEPASDERTQAEPEHKDADDERDRDGPDPVVDRQQALPRNLVDKAREPRAKADGREERGDAP